MKHETNAEWQSQFDETDNKEHSHVPGSKRRKPNTEAHRKGAQNLYANRDTIPATPKSGSISHTPRGKNSGKV